MIPNFNNNGPCFELFNVQNDVIKYWKFKPKITKEFDPQNKSYSYLLHTGGVSCLSTPIDERRSLQITNSCLLFQFILYNIKPFSIEICVRDKSDTKRRFNITSGVKEVESKSLYIKIPFTNYPLNIWTNLLVDLNSLTKAFIKTQTFKTMESIHITGNLKIRKIFSLRSKEEPVLKSVDLGKSIPSVNLLIMENGNLTNTNIKIIGVHNPTHINTVNIDSKLIQDKKEGSPSPQPNNRKNYSTTSDIMLNRHKQMYQKKKEPNSINNININININNVKKDQVAIKIKNDNEFIKKLPNADNLVNNLKYKKENINFKKFVNNMKINEEGDNSANFAIHNININNITNNTNNTNINNTNINNAMKNNFVENKKSLGNYIQNQKNKKRNKSNNPYLRPKINKRKENSVIKEEKSLKKFNNLNNVTNKPSNKKLENVIKPEKKEKINQAKDKKNIEIKNEISNSINNNNYYDSKEKEISLEDYSPDTRDENKFKFNNIPLGNSLVNKKEEERETKLDSNSINNSNSNMASFQKSNKFSNYNMLMESGLDIKNIPVYDNIEEVAEWPGGDWNAAQGEGVGDKLIKLDYTKKPTKKKEKINFDEEDLLEMNALEKKDTYRPYTPPIEELVQVDPNKIVGNSNMKVSLDKNNIKRKGTFKNYENLEYIEEKGLLFDPITKLYYDIKAK